MTPQGMNLSRLSAVALLGSAMTTLAGPTNIPSITVNPYLPAAVSPGRVFLAVASASPDVGNYLLIVNHDGSLAWSR